MKAAVIYSPGDPSVFKIEEVTTTSPQTPNPTQTQTNPSQRPIPTPKPGWVLIHVKACGLNRSEMFTRQGHSPNVKFPRILGIEATGLVEDAPSGEFAKGDVVATAMGEMGRAYDGGYVSGRSFLD
jgi:NADPH:quinone reductase-like Zn-dependent oxidoreductase